MIQPMEFERGQRVYVEGDAPEICTASYTVPVASWATVVDEASQDDDYVLLSIDEIGGDKNAWVYVKKTDLTIRFISARFRREKA